jgi:hypothetical protein
VTGPGARVHPTFGRGVLLAAILLAGSGLVADEPPPPTGEEVTPAEASQDPDLPGFLEGRIDKGQYLQERSGALERLLAGLGADAVVVRTRGELDGSAA